MKRILRLVVVFVTSNLVSIASIGTYISPIAAQDHGLQNVSNALDFPRSSERFFGEGQRQLEQEIQRLEQGSKVQTTDLLKIDPAISQQQQNFQQYEQPPLDGVSTPQNPALPINPLKESVH